MICAQMVLPVGTTILNLTEFKIIQCNGICTDTDTRTADDFTVLTLDAILLTCRRNQRTLNKIS